MSARTNRFQIQALRTQFPFLFKWPEPAEGGSPTDVLPARTAPLVREDRVFSMSVSRITPELLAATPRRDGATGTQVGIDDDLAYFLLDEAGNLIGEVWQDLLFHHYGKHDESDEGETIGEAIARLHAESRCAMILRRHTGFIIENHHSVGGYEVVVYLPPKGWTIAGWCAEQQTRANARVAAQVAAVTSPQ